MSFLRENLIRRVSIRKSLWKRNKIEQFLNQLVTGNEKWITTSQAGTNNQQAGIDGEKGFLDVFGWIGERPSTKYELFPYGLILNSNLHCQ